MAVTKISQRTLANELADDDEFVVVDKSDASEAASGTTKRGLFSLLRSWVRNAISPSTSQEWHVDDINGDDANNGTTQGTALKSLSALANRIATLQKPGTKTTLYLYPHSDVEGYDGHELTALIPIILGEFEIVGVGTNTVAGPFTIQSYLDANFQRLNCGPQGWTFNQWSGYDIEIATSATAGFVGLRRTIATNFANSISILERVRYIENDAWTSEVEIGATFNVVEPAVKINVASPSSGFLATKSLTFVGGTGVRSPNSGLGPMSGGVLRMFNVELRVPDGMADAPKFTGTVETYGVHVTTDTAANVYIDIINAVFRAGHWQQIDGALPGWGFSTRSRSVANPRRSRIRFSSTHGSQLFVSCGPIAMVAGSEIYLRNVMVDMTGHSAGFPHAAIYVGSGCLLYTASEADQECFYVLSVAGAYDIESEGSTVQTSAPIQHLGQGALSRARDKGLVQLDSAGGPDGVIVHDGTGGTENVGATMPATGLYAQYGGQIRLLRWDGAAANTARAGQVSPTDRDLAASPLAINDIVDGSESSHIYRTA